MLHSSILICIIHRNILSIVLQVFLLDIIKNDMSTFIHLKFMKAEDIEAALTLLRKSVKKLSSHAMWLVDAFDVKPWMVHAPIASDWEKYNAYDNRGELVNVPLAKF